MLGFSIPLIYNSLSIPNPNVSLLQIPDTSNEKHFLSCLSPFLSKKRHLATFIIGVSFLYGLLLKFAISRAFQYEYTPINTTLPILRPKSRPICKKKVLLL